MRRSNPRIERWIGPGLIVAVFVIGSFAMGRNQREAVDLHRIAWSTLREATAVGNRLTVPRSGERRALRGETLAMLTLLRRRQPDGYRCSPAIRESGYLFQRLVESAWPIRYDEGSRFVLSFVWEPSDCRQLAVRYYEVPTANGPTTSDRNGVRLARCR